MSQFALLEQGKFIWGVYVKLSFIAEGQTPGKVDNTEENPGLEEKDA